MTPSTILRAILALGCGLCACMDPDEPGRLVPATVLEDDTLPSLALDDTTVHLQTLGDPDDPVVIVLHGGPGNDFRYMLRLVESLEGPSLAEDYFFVFWDQRGAGLSQRHDPDEITLAAYLRDLEQVVDSFAPGRAVVLLGHSWGGQYAAMYMNAHPERVAGAVLAEPGRFSSQIVEPEEDFEFDYTAEYLGDYTWGRQFFSLSDHARADHYASTLMLEPTNGRVEDPSPNWRVGAVVLTTLYLEQLQGTEWDFSARLYEVEPEILLVVGDRSTDLGEDFQRTQQAFLGDSRIAIIPEAGHTDVVYSRAEATVPVLREYLASLDLEGV